LSLTASEETLLLFIHLYYLYILILSVTHFSTQYYGLNLVIRGFCVAEHLGIKQ